MNCGCDIKTKGFHDWLIYRLTKSDSVKLETLRLLGLLSPRLDIKISNSSITKALSIVKSHFPEEHDNLIKLLILK